MNPKKKKIIFLRHGETTYNQKGLCNDDPSIPVSLTRNGRMQAREVAESLKGEKIDLIVVSAFARTQETAQIINQYHQAPIIIDQRINDRKTGIFEGRPNWQFRQYIKDPITGKAPGGESYIDEKKRVLEFFSWIRQTHQRNILVVTHHEPMRIIQGYIEGLSDKEAYEKRINNCEKIAISLPLNQYQEC